MLIPDNLGIRPLFVAIISEKLPVARYLLENGASPNSTYEPTRWTLLHLAAHIGNYEIVESLLEHGAGKYPEETILFSYRKNGLNIPTTSLS
jgi:ankyrin repeat protein